MLDSAKPGPEGVEPPTLLEIQRVRITQAIATLREEIRTFSADPEATRAAIIARLKKDKD